MLDRLAAESGDLVRLAVVNGRELFWVAKAQGSLHGLRYDPDMGQVARLSYSASGHAWLSCLSDEEVLLLVKRQGFGLRSAYGAPRARDGGGAVEVSAQGKEARVQHGDADVYVWH